MTDNILQLCSLRFKIRQQSRLIDKGNIRWSVNAVLRRAELMKEYAKLIECESSSFLYKK